MSVSSSVEYFFSKKEQLDVAKKFTYQLNGRGQENLDIVDLMELDYENKRLNLYNCFCEADFIWIVPELSEFIARKVPLSDFTCQADFLNEVGGETIDYEISYKEGILDTGYYGYEDREVLNFTIPAAFWDSEEYEEVVEYICYYLDYDVRCIMDPIPNYLICDDKNSILPEVQEARKKNIPIISRAEFAEKFGSVENPMEIKKTFKHHLIKIF